MPSENEEQTITTKLNLGQQQARLSDNDISQLQPAAALRQVVYGFLSNAYLRPLSEQFLSQCGNADFRHEFASSLPGPATDCLCQTLISLAQEDPKQLRAELKQEYMNLFSVPTAQYVAPFEDIYRGKSADGQSYHGPLLGVRAIAAKRMYRAAGAQLENTCKELPNHIGVELAFMQFLCERELASINNDSDKPLLSSSERKDEIFTETEVYRAYQIRFLDQHLCDWIPQLHEEIQLKAKHAFYKQLADVTLDFLTRDLHGLRTFFAASMQ